ncbi:S-adenosyl-L-methionine-dependent methyltransferase [Xylaria bambusicola]|uniref:S-adenosyl-L-methionine-dependent methyltransferase n=1 Tax=Xylaria bambusicola TaxID=326684 RepID=UPI00200790A3|nr:S-adenosyl-L-methionine-dependent methyltransferase [Xylaria bambusicola]KAI0513084.1 S-adenosyl-L-methionine-dependent methyltransferase [Xylaria bambusicola]
MSAEASKHITDTEWSKVAPAMMQMMASGPGVAPAQHMAEHADKLLPFSKATVIVDMGCGPGQVTNAVFKAHHTNIPTSAKVIGADNNAEMLAQYNNQRNMEIEKGNSWWESAEILEVDVHKCDTLEDDSVSHMLAGFVLFLVPNPAQAISAMKRVMAPGGVLAMSAMVGGDWVTLSMYPLKVRPDLVMEVPSNSCTSHKDVTNHLKNAGFTDIEVIDVENYMEFDDYEVVCRFILNKIPMTARAIAQMTHEEITKTQDMMVADLRSWYPTLPAKMKGQTNVAYARK